MHIIIIMLADSSDAAHGERGILNFRVIRTLAPEAPADAALAAGAIFSLSGSTFCFSGSACVENLILSADHEGDANIASSSAGKIRYLATVLSHLCGFVDLSLQLIRRLRVLKLLW